jgi:hypothetical protein
LDFGISLTGSVCSGHNISARTKTGNCQFLKGLIKQRRVLGAAPLLEKHLGCARPLSD